MFPILKDPTKINTIIGQTIDQNKIWNSKLENDFNFQCIQKYPEIKIKQFTQTKLILRNSKLKSVPNGLSIKVADVGNVRDGI